MDGAGGYLRQSGQLPLQFLLQARNACHCCRLFLVLSPLFNIDINPCRYFDVCSFPADSYGKVRLPMGLLCVKTDHNTLIEKTVKLRTSRLISMQYEHRPLRVVRGRWNFSTGIATIRMEPYISEPSVKRRLYSGLWYTIGSGPGLCQNTSRRTDLMTYESCILMILPRLDISSGPVIE